MTDDRRMPDAWMVRAPATKPELFTDYGKALAYSIRVGGWIVPLYEGPNTKPSEPRDDEGAK